MSRIEQKQGIPPIAVILIAVALVAGIGWWLFRATAGPAQAPVTVGPQSVMPGGNPTGPPR